MSHAPTPRARPSRLRALAGLAVGLASLAVACEGPGSGGPLPVPDEPPEELNAGEVLDPRSGREWAGAIRGRVVDPCGHPVAGVPVRSTSNVLRPGRFHVGHTIGEWDATRLDVLTDVDGTYWIPGLRPTEYVILTRSPEHAPAGAHDLVVRDGEVLVVPDLVLRPASTLSGQVVDAGGAPLEGWFVSVQHEWPETRVGCTDSSGRFTVPGVPPGDHLVWIYPDPFRGAGPEGFRRRFRSTPVSVSKGVDVPDLVLVGDR